MGARADRFFRDQAERMSGRRRLWVIAGASVLAQLIAWSVARKAARRAQLELSV